MKIINFQNHKKINLFISKMIYPVLRGTLFLFIGIFLLTASIEPARALEVNLFGQDNFVYGTINEGVNFDWMSQEPWLCVLNNNLCNNNVKNPNDAGSQNSNIFNIIDDVVENHAADVNIRMFEFRIETDTENAEFVKNEGVHLKEELSDVHKTREILENYLKSGTISHEAYTATLKQNEKKEKYNKKKATEMASIIRKKNRELSDKFEKILGEKDNSSDSSQDLKETKTPKVTKTPEPTRTQGSLNTLVPAKTSVPTKTPEPTKTSVPTKTPEEPEDDD